MTEKQKEEITEIAKQFVSGFGDIELNGSGWLIVDPLSAYLGALGYENKLEQMRASNQHPQVLIMTFKDGSKFIPAGGDLTKLHKGFKNYHWL